MDWTATAAEDVGPQPSHGQASVPGAETNGRRGHQLRWAAAWLGAIFVVGVGVTLLGTFIDQGSKTFEFSPVRGMVLASLAENAGYAAAGLTFVGVTIEAWIATVGRNWRSVEAWAGFVAAAAAGGLAALVAFVTVVFTAMFTRVTVLFGNGLWLSLFCWLFVLCTYTPLALWLAWRNGGRLDRWFRARSTAAALSRR